MNEDKNTKKTKHEQMPNKYKRNKWEAFCWFIIPFILTLCLLGVLGFRSMVQNFISDATKPIIYLYPTEETVVNVTVGYPENFTCVYPAYNDGWHVLAQPNGDLTDLNTGRHQYSLYYESKHAYPYELTNTGFVVKGEDTASFLEDKLAILGLSEREADEFIIYWLPILESNNYNHIRFATMDEINADMPLNIEPAPETLIRVFMLFKGLDEPIEVQEQILTTPERTGFTVVEWGGSEFK